MGGGRVIRRKNRRGACAYGIIRVHVQPSVFVWAIGDAEAVVPIEALALDGEESLCEWMDVLLQGGQRRPQANFIQDEPVIVHAIWAANREAGRLVVQHLLNQPFTCLVRKQWKGIDLTHRLLN